MPDVIARARTAGTWSRAYDYVVVDVFADRPFGGNPLAVFLDADGLADDELAAIARELNLSETAFVLPAREPSTIARVRIFTPTRELSFAGHPTIGTAFALARAGRLDRDDFALEEGVGPVALRIERRDPFLAWLRTPPIAFGPRFERAACARALALDDDDVSADLPIEVASAGAPFLYVALRDRAAVDRARLDPVAMARAVPHAGSDEVFVFALVPGGVYARMFAPALGIPEDPATGGATGPLGAYLARHGVLELRNGVRFTNEQGVAMGRPSRIDGILHVRDGALDFVEIGGSAVAIVAATMSLPYAAR